MNRLGYIPQIDGLRAISIGMVLLTHANFQLGTYGIIGVDVFFAISGFLITTLIMEEFSRTGTVSINKFYWRRAARLLPALFLLLIGVWIYSLLLSDVQRVQDIRFEILASLFYFYNLAWLFEPIAQPVLGHMWSLAVEEQFYLIWPLVLIVFLKKNWSIHLPILFLGFVLVSLVLKFSGLSSDIWNSLFHESLFLGCAFAVLRKYYSIPKIHEYWYIGSLVILVIIGVFLPTGVSSYANAFLHISGGILGLVAIAYCLQNRQEQILGNPLMIYIGKISYSLYLWHVPIFKWFKWHSPLEPWQSFILKFVVTFLIAMVSYHLLERPVMDRRKDAFKRKKLQKF